MRLNTTWLIYLCTLMLVTTGVIMVYSSSAAIAARDTLRKSAEKAKDREASSTDILETTTHSTYYLKRQAIFAVIAIVVMLFLYQIDYERYKKYATPCLLAAGVMLVLVFLPKIGVERKGSHRWINLGFTQVQASEFAKLAMILYMAKKLGERQGDLRSFVRGFLPSLVVLGIYLGLIVKEPDLGGAVMLGVIVFSMWYVSGMRIIHLCSLGIAAFPVVVYEIATKPWRVKRILAFLDPIANRETTGWQLVQSSISVAAGGISGLGLGQGPQKYLFLSEGHTDFIYAGICEEFGMIGALLVFFAYAFFVIQGIRVASRATDMYASLLATGITTMIGVQAFINMYVVVGLLPTKGLTLPLISYGGSSLVINCAAIGILMNISRFTEIASNPSRAPAA